MVVGAIERRKVVVSNAYGGRLSPRFGGWFYHRYSTVGSWGEKLELFHRFIVSS
jgi:hypothetical protein